MSTSESESGFCWNTSEESEYVYESQYTCLQYDPIQEKHNIFRCQQFKVAWNPSKQLVWASGDNFLIAVSNLVFPNINWSLSKAGVPKSTVMQQL